MARALGALGHDVHGIALAPREKPLGTGVDGVSIHAEDRGRLWPWFPLAWSQAVARRIRAAGPFDVVLAPEFRAEAERYGARPDAGPLVTHLLTSQAQLSTVRPDLTLLERHGPRTRLQLAMERRQAERSRGLLVPGHAILDWARELWGLDGVPVETVPLSIDFDFVRAAAAEGPLPDGWPHGAPTVTLASGLDEYLRDGENGVLVGRNDVDELADAVERLLDDAPLRERLGAAAERTAAELVPSQTAPRYVEALERLAGSANVQ